MAIPGESEDVKQYIRELPGVDASTVESCLAIRWLVNRIHGNLAEYAGQQHFVVPHFEALRLLYHHPEGRMVPAELAMQVRQARGSFTNTMQCLERRGLVRVEGVFIERRQPEYYRTHRRQRRDMKLVLTDAGRELMARILPDYYARIVRLIEPFKVKERQALPEMLEKLMQASARIPPRTSKADLEAQMGMPGRGRRRRRGVSSGPRPASS